MQVRALSALSCLLLSGCLGAETFEMPAVEGAASLFVVQRLGTEDAVGAFYPPGQAPEVLEAGPVWIFALEGAIDGLVPFGAPVDTRRPEPTQPLPPIRAALYADAPGEDLLVWEAPADALEGFRLPLPDPLACLDEQGGCLSVQAPVRCQSPCPIAPHIAAPQLAAPPCPEGWVPVDGLRPGSMCAPPLVPRRDCAAHEWQGEGPECAPLAECPQGRWPTPPAGAGPVLYLDPSAGPGGDGSEARPFAGLEALSGAPAGARVLVAAGQLQGSLPDTQAELHIIGRCPQDSRWSTSTPISVRGDLEISALHVDSSTDAFVIGPDARLSLHGTSVHASGVAVRARGGDLRARRVRLRARRGVRADFARLDLEGLDFEGERFFEGPHTRLEVADFRLVGVNNGPGEAPESMVEMDVGTRAELARGRVHAGRYAGISTPRVAAGLVLEDVQFTGRYSFAVLAEPLDTETTTTTMPARMSRVRFENVVRAIRSTALDLDARDIVVLDAGHVGLDLRQGGVARQHLSIHNLWVHSKGENGVRIGDTRRAAPGVSVEGSHWVIELGVHPEDGAVVEVQENASLQLSHASLYGPDRQGLQIKCANAELEDVHLVHGGPHGIIAQPASQLDLRRVRVVTERGGGLKGRVLGPCARGGTHLEDVVFDGCEGCGIALAVPSGVGITGERVRISGYEAGVEVTEDTHVSLTNSVVEGNSIGFVVPSGYDLLDLLRGVRLANARNVDLQ